VIESRNPVMVAALVAGSAWGLTTSAGGHGSPGGETRAAQPDALAMNRVVAAAPRPRPVSFGVARVKGDAVAYSSSPGGAALGSLAARTEFGSPRLLHVARRRGPFLGVPAPERPNDRLAWIDSRRGVSLRRTAVSLRVDLSRRLLRVYRGRVAVARIAIGVGAAGSPTPPGRFAVTDKLPGARFSSSYGCCILALSGNQPNTPAGWTGGTRLAIHGAASSSPGGTAASAGCLRAADKDMRFLMRAVPLGAPVMVRG
jgi:hypothetical protein